MGMLVSDLQALHADGEKDKAKSERCSPNSVLAFHVQLESSEGQTGGECQDSWELRRARDLPRTCVPGREERGQPAAMGET